MNLEAFLARLYTDQELLERFLRAPERVARDADLEERDIAALQNIDREGLRMAATSFAHKRRSR